MTDIPAPMAAPQERSALFFPAIIAALVCSVLCLAGLINRPLFPVDETRYLTVAWEMHQSGNWILPSLNHEAYDHKPPVLFWLINILWKIFGVSQQAAMVIPFLAGFVVLLLSAKLAQTLKPDDRDIPLYTTCLLAGSLPFALYSNLIMFDLLLTVPVLIGALGLWNFTKTGKIKHLGLVTLAVGLGALVKGPVILLHLIFPAVFIRYWNTAPSVTIPRSKWIISLTVAILLGVALALCWAIPAGIEGGPAFREKIFWGQTAGRMVKAFDHQRPFWWYLGFVPLLTLPWLVSPIVWKGFRAFKSNQDQTTQSLRRYLAVWILPVFVSFSLISGKQVHYLLPLLPPLAILGALALGELKDRLTAKSIMPSLLLIASLSLVPLVAKMLSATLTAKLEKASNLPDILAPLPLHITAATAGAILLILALSLYKKTARAAMLSVTVAMTIAMAGFQYEARNSLYPTYDLTPLSSVIAKNPGTPLAFVRNYHGEFGFLARLDRPVKQILPPDLEGWFKENPNGMVLIRTANEQEFSGYDVLTTMPYRTGNTYAAIVPKGKLDQYKK